MLSKTSSFSQGFFIKKLFLLGIINKEQKQIIFLDAMTGWKKFSTLAELEKPLIQFQNELVEGGNALQELLGVLHPNVDAVLNAIESIKSQLNEEGIFDTWVTAHVRVGEKDKLIANKRVCQVSPSLFFHLTTMLTCM